MRRELENLIAAVVVVLALIGSYAVVRVVILKQPENCPMVENPHG